MLIGLILLTGIAVRASDEKRCSAKASSCERSIRDMMLGRKYLGVRFSDSRSGLVVKAIIDGSPAAKSGLRVGDRILTVNGVDCSKADMRRFKTVLKNAKEDSEITMAVFRLGSLKWVTIELQQMSKEQIDRVVASHMRDAHEAAPHGEQR